MSSLKGKIANNSEPITLIANKVVITNMNTTNKKPIKSLNFHLKEKFELFYLILDKNHFKISLFSSGNTKDPTPRVGVLLN
jgi:hypothetical protein